MTENLLTKKLVSKLRRLYWKTLLRFQETVTVPRNRACSPCRAPTMSLARICTAVASSNWV